MARGGLRQDGSCQKAVDMWAAQQVAEARVCTASVQVPAAHLSAIRLETSSDIAPDLMSRLSGVNRRHWCT